MRVPGVTGIGRFFVALTLSLSVFAAGACSDNPDNGGSADTDSVITEPDGGLTDVPTSQNPDADEIPDAKADTGGAFPDAPKWDTSAEDAGDTGLGDLKLSRVTPDRGPVAGGTQFVIEGRGFTKKTEIYFGSRQAEVSLVDRKLVGQTPKAPGPGKVSVKGLDPMTGEDVLAGGFTYTTTLTLKSAMPDRIPTDGGIEVTLKGTGFDQKTRVSFDGKTALSQTIVDDETMRVVAPANAAGPADVRLTNRDASTVARDAVDYFEPLAIDEVRPATGPTGGGTQVGLKGNGFSSKMTVSFGGKNATLKSVNSKGTEATVTTPSHTSGLVDVAVQTPSGDAEIREDAFYYRSSSSEFTVASVSPDIGQASGNIDVTLIGAGLDANGLSVEFGGKSATISSQGPGHVVVKNPAHMPGKVDVVAKDGQGNSSTLKDGFEYLADIALDTVNPNSGKAAGGTKVTLKGKGFNNASRVEFGGIPAKFTVKSGTEISATTPRHAPGMVDVVVERGEVSAELEDGFTFTEQMKLFGFSPVRGSMAGNTYVVIRGRGFMGKMGVTFGSAAGKAVKILDTQTLAVRTPRHKPAAVDVKVTKNGKTRKAAQQYTYFNPGSRNGGAWGGPIKGAVNVSVYSQGGSPVPGAFVMLSTNPNTTYQGTTDQNGLVTLSGPDVYGEQTITATAPKYSSATVQHVNAENITIFLAPPPSQGPPPPGPPTATFKGKISGLNKIAEPGPNQYHTAVVFATKKSPWSNPPDPGGGNVISEDGPYTLKTRIGDLALVAVGGLSNGKTGELTPIMMGVKRYQFAAEGKTYKRDIKLNIPLNNVLSFKLKNPPHDKNGPDTNRVIPYMDFGFEGVFGELDFAQGTTAIIKAKHQAHLRGKLSDVSYLAVGGSYTKTTDTMGNEQLGAPQSVAIKRGITKTGTTIDMPTLVGVPIITTPMPGGKPTNNLIKWRLNSSNQPDFFYVQILTPMRRPVWEAFVPGTATSVRLPNFPDFSHLPKSQRPVPYPGGSYSLMVVGIRHPGVSYRNFSYADLSIDKWEAFSLNGHVISF